MQEKVQQMFKPNSVLIRQHLQFIADGMKQYEEGRLEISYGDDKNRPTHSENFAIDEIEKATNFAVDKNTSGKNVYVTGALLDPDAESMVNSRRSSDGDFFACNSIWCDIDNKGAPITPNELRKKYEHFPPSLVVVTGRHHDGQPHLRVHLWWKLDEPITNGDEIRKLVRGIQQTLGGDPATTNECRIMRIGGSVAWPTESKPGRVTEQTEVTIPDGAQKVVNADALARAFPESVSDAVIAQSVESSEKKYHSTVAGLQPETVDDGRDFYMSNMVFASTINLTGALGRWPTAQEIFDDVWPAYSRKVPKPRDPRKTLDDEGRGAKEVQHKIRSKLRLFESGRMKRAGRPVTVEWCTEQHKRNAAEALSQEAKATSSSMSGVSYETSTETHASVEAMKSFRLIDWIASNKYAGSAPPIRWLVEGIFPLGVPCLLAAMGGLGKSFIALDMAIKIAMPRNTMGEQKVLGHDVKEYGKVVLLTAEDSFDSIHRRINKLAPSEKLQSTKDNLIIIPMSSVDFSQLLVKEGKAGLEMTDVFTEIKKQLMEIKDLRLVAIDPLQAFVGADITSKPEAAQFMWSAFAKIAAQTGATFLATHHMRKDGTSEIKTAADAREGIRGTTGLVDGARVAYVMWQTVKEIGEAISHKIAQPYEAHRYIQGAVVKANDEADHSVMSFHREDSGVLACHGIVDTTAASRKAGILTEAQDFIYRAILDALEGASRSHKPPGQPTMKMITYEEFYAQLERMGYKKYITKEGDEEAPEKVATKIKNSTTNARVRLKRKGKIDFNKEYIWVPPEEEPAYAELPVQRRGDDPNEF